MAMQIKPAQLRTGATVSVGYAMIANKGVPATIDYNLLFCTAAGYGFRLSTRMYERVDAASASIKTYWLAVAVRGIAKKGIRDKYDSPTTRSDL